MRTGAASTVGARRHRPNENDVTMTVAGLRRYGDWRHVATGCDLHRSGFSENCCENLSVDFNESYYY